MFPLGEYLPMFPLGEYLPMFPLGRGILPGAGLTLRVFESRYLEMIDLCVRRDSGFGVVLIERGSEVGGGDVRFNTGVAVTITEVGSLGDGHLIVMARGNTRIRVAEWLEDAPYPQARVRRLVDLTGFAVDARSRRRLERELSRGLAMFSEMGMATGAIEPLPDEISAAAYRALDVFPVPDLDRQKILEIDDPVERIDASIAALESVQPTIRGAPGRTLIAGSR